MNFLDFSSLGLWLNVAIFAVAACFVWAAGTRLTRYLDVIAEKAGLGEAFVGMLFIGGITSLPEVAAVSSSAFIGNAALATNNIFGSVSINLLLIAAADALLGRDAITSTVAQPTTLMQGVLVMLALVLIVAAVLIGDIDLGWFGAWSLALLAFSVFAFWMSSRYSRSAPWRIVESDSGDGVEFKQTPAAEQRRRSYLEMSLQRLIAMTAAAALLILVAGFALAQSADALSKLTGFGSGIIGLVLVGFATSLPELSSISMAVRLRRYEMALGDIFGTNVLTLGLIFLVDLIYSGGPVLNEAGRFEAVAALLGAALTGTFLIGLLERGNRTILRMGYDAVAALFIFAGGIVLLYFIQSG